MEQPKFQLYPDITLSIISWSWAVSSTQNLCKMWYHKQVKKNISSRLFEPPIKICYGFASNINISSKNLRDLQFWEMSFAQNLAKSWKNEIIPCTIVWKCTFWHENLVFRQFLGQKVRFQTIVHGIISFFQDLAKFWANDISQNLITRIFFDEILMFDVNP